MNLAEQMRAKSKEVTNKDKLDILFKELVLPRIEKDAEAKRTETSFSSFSRNDLDKRVNDVFPKIYTLQDLVGGEMKPYLEDMGFKVILCSPSYYTYIRW